MLHPDNPDTAPPGGQWTYRDPVSGVLFAHPVLRVLVKRIRRHWEATDRSITGEFVPMIHDAICRQNEWLKCTDDNETDHFTLTDLARFGETFTAWLGSGGQFVPQEIADVRADICRDCPHNITLHGCFGCRGLLKLVVQNMAGKRARHDDELKSCKICKCYLPAKVWLPADVMSSRDIPDSAWPSFCWLKDKA